MDAMKRENLAQLNAIIAREEAYNQSYLEKYGHIYPGVKRFMAHLYQRREALERMITDVQERQHGE